jgi:diguanylate cyclase (GGDEF)-like protein
MNRLLRSTSARASLYQFLGLCLVVAVAGGFQYLALRREINHEVTNSARAVLEALEATIEHDREILGSRALQPILMAVAADAPGVVHLSVIGRDLRVLADTDPRHVGAITDQTSVIQLMARPVESAIPLLYSRAGGNFARLSDPIDGPAGVGPDGAPRPGRVLGAITVDVGLSRAEARLWNSFLRSLVFIACVLALYLLGEYLLFRRSVFRPLARLATAAEDFGAGLLDTRLPVQGARDEFGAVGRAFNAMAARVQQTNAALVDSAAAMAGVNRALSDSVAHLERRSAELATLGALGETLQACNTLAECGQAVEIAVGRLFPGTTSGLYEIPASRVQFQPVDGTAGITAGAQAFPLDACWALRLGHVHRHTREAPGLPCAHVDTAPDAGYLCAPMMAQGEAIGLLHVRGVDGQPFEPDAEHVQLASTLAEQAALSIANLKLREALRQQAIRDGLTGLFNRRYLDETLAREIARAHRAGQPLGVLMIDVDHFKQFNDRYGHEAGDVVLKALGAILRRQVRAEDIPCRYGGEEFCLILPGAPLEASLARAEALRAELARLHLQHDGRSLGAVSLSVGVAVFPDHGEAGPDLLKAADAALYQAKRAGRDRVQSA